MIRLKRAFLRPAYLLGFLLIAAPWTLGGKLPWANAAALALALLVFAAWVRESRKQNRRNLWPIILTPALFGLALIAFQLLPLPLAVLQLLNPEHASHVRSSLVPMGLSSFQAISIDPPSTARALCLGLVMTLVAFVSAQLSREKRTERQLIFFVFCSGALVALIGFLHKLASEPILFSKVKFIATHSFVTPFGNVNHFTGALLLSSAAVLAFALTSKTRSLQLMWVGIDVIFGGLVVFSHSRGGAASFVVLHLVLAAIMVRKNIVGLKLIALVGAVALSIGLGSFFGGEALEARFATLTELGTKANNKTLFYPMFFSAIENFARLGMGADAFEFGMSKFQTDQLDTTFTHPENFVIQAFADFGFFFGALFLFALLWALWEISVALKKPEELSLFAGLCAILCHDLLDFSLTFLPTAVLASTLFGILASKTKLIELKMPQVTVSAFASAGLMLAVAPLSFDTHRIDAQNIATASVETDDDAKNVCLRAVAHVKHHPWDSSVYSACARAHAIRNSFEPALAWLNRALLLTPNDARLHMLAGFVLERMGQLSQATLEYSLAMNENVPQAIESVARTVRSAEQVLQLTEKDDRHFLALIDAVYRLNNQDFALEIIEAYRNEPERVVNVSQWVELAAWLSRHGRAELSETLLETAQKHGASAVRIADIRSTNFLNANDVKSAKSTLEVVFKETRDPHLAVSLAEIFLVEGQNARARDLVKPLVAQLPSNDQARVFRVMTKSYQNDNMLNLAAKTYEEWSTFDPNNAERLYEWAAVLEKLERYQHAIQIVRRGQQLDTNEGAAAHDGWLERLSKATNTKVIQDSGNQKENVLP